MHDACAVQASAFQAHQICHVCDARLARIVKDCCNRRRRAQAAGSAASALHPLIRVLFVLPEHLQNSRPLHALIASLVLLEVIAWKDQPHFLVSEHAERVHFLIWAQEFPHIVCLVPPESTACQTHLLQHWEIAPQDLMLQLAKAYRRRACLVPLQRLH